MPINQRWQLQLVHQMWSFQMGKHARLQKVANKLPLYRPLIEPGTKGNSAQYKRGTHWMLFMRILFLRLS